MDQIIEKGIVLPEILTKQIVINNINKVKYDKKIKVDMIVFLM